MGDGSGAGVEVLLVEDNPGDVRLVEEALGEGDCSLLVTRDGADALDLLRQRREATAASLPDVVLLDLNLPTVDGARVLEEIRSDPELRSVRIVVLTSARRESTDIDLEGIAETDFLTKPTDPDRFMRLVRSHVLD